MKHGRHDAIREVVGSTPVSNQDELRRMLLKRGFDVTQATLSRDIRELQLFKGPRGYALPNGEADEDIRPSAEDVLGNFGAPRSSSVESTCAHDCRGQRADSRHRD